MLYKMSGFVLSTELTKIVFRYISLKNIHDTCITSKCEKMCKIYHKYKIWVGIKLRKIFKKEFPSYLIIKKKLDVNLGILF